MKRHTRQPACTPTAMRQPNLTHDGEGFTDAATHTEITDHQKAISATSNAHTKDATNTQKWVTTAPHLHTAMITDIWHIKKMKVAARKNRVNAFYQPALTNKKLIQKREEHGHAVRMSAIRNGWN